MPILAQAHLVLDLCTVRLYLTSVEQEDSATSGEDEEDKRVLHCCTTYWIASLYKFAVRTVI